MELNLVFEFAIALTIAPLVFCWAIDLAHLIQSIHRGQFREFAKDCTSKTVSAGNHLAIAPDTQSDTKLDQDHLPRPLYASKTVKHYVAEGYPDKLGVRLLHSIPPRNRLPNRWLIISPPWDWETRN
jgi:hypothetical protein